MNQMEHLTSSQKRRLYELCWKFEEAWASDQQACPSDWVSRIDGIDSQYVLFELEETLKELRQQVNENLSSQNKDRYDFQEEIARGGTGVIWRVWDKHLQRPSAIKYLLDTSDNREMRARLRQEARICARLMHPGIVPIHELGSFSDGRPFVCMKLIEGKTLLQLLKSTPSPPMEKLIEHFTNICHAVAFAHGQNIIHRDLTPSNIMVGPFGEVQIMDWGLAKDLSSKTLEEDGETIANQFGGPSLSHVPIKKTEATVSLESERTRQGVVLGTIAYLSPEQASGHVDQIDTRSDVFSLGAILCRLLTGFPPYTEPNQEILLSHAQRGTLRPALERLQNSPYRAWAKLAVQCMSNDRNSRPADASCILRELDRIQTFAKRRRAILQFSWVGGFFAIVILVWMFRSGMDSRKADVVSAQSENFLVTDPEVLQSLIAARDDSIFLRSYRAAMEKNPTDINLHYAICVALLNKHRLSEAQAIATKLTKLDSNRAAPYFYLGESQYLQGQFFEALGSIHEAERRLVTDTQVKLPIDEKTKLYKRSIVLLEKIKGSFDPASYDSEELLEMGKVCELTQRTALAVEYFRNALAKELDQRQRSKDRFHIIVGFAANSIRQEDLSTELRGQVCDVVLEWLNQQYNFAVFGNDEGSVVTRNEEELSLIRDVMPQLRTDLRYGNTRRFIDDAIANPKIAAKNRIEFEEFRNKVARLQ